MKNRQFAWKGPTLAALFLLPCHAALADNGTSNPPASNSQALPTFHPNLYKFSAQHLEDKPYSGATRDNGGPALQQNKPVEQEPTKSGLHWTNVDSHPGLGYQVDKNEELRLHFGGHGAKASFALRF